MRSIFLIAIFIFALPQIIYAQVAPAKLWDKTIGGNEQDQLYVLKQMLDGGYILGGESVSNITGDKSEVCRGSSDYWVVKLDASGNKQWDRTFGGSSFDKLTAIQQTLDGGFILGGWSNSNISGDKSQNIKGWMDYWVVKLNPACEDLTATLSNSCNNGTTSVNIKIIGIQPVGSGSSSWTLTYSLNGANHTVSGNSPDFILAQNPPQGSNFTLLNITSGTCSTILNNSIIVQSVPGPPLVNSGNNCGVGSVTLSATGAPAGGSYLWYNVPTGGTAIHTSANGNFTTPVLASTTTYYVATANSAGCEGPRTPVIATITKLSVNVGVDEEMCVSAAPIQLSGFSPAGGAWSGAGVSSSGIFTPAGNLVGKQTLTYTVSQNGCTTSATKYIIVKNPADLGPDQEACEGEELTLRPNNYSGTFLWSDGSTGKVLQVRQSGTYWVKLTGNDCIATDTIQVLFKACPVAIIPNIITPNADGYNDKFKPQNLSLGRWEMQIFNRWGIKLFESDDYQNSWPETEIGDGTYFYLLKNSETSQQFKGWLEVVH